MAGRVVRLSVDGPAVGELDDAPLPRCAAIPEDLAYVIYTSGSTGVPKGVMIEHGGALNTINDINARFGVSAEDRVLALSAFNFDLSVYDVFGLLSVGGAVVLPEPGAHREPAQWARLAARHRVTVWNSVPTLMEMLADHLRAQDMAEVPPLRVVMMSGDWIPVTLPGRIHDLVPGTEIWSLGGATEASIWSILYPIEKVDPGWASIPYGKPMLNQQIHVLNDALQPCPTWVPGHLYIGGTGLARGYLNDEAKTRASFIEHPAAGDRLYRTGDLGRYLPDGNVEFLGRQDFQVKIQGYRVELGEIEAGLLRCPGVRAAAAIAWGERHEAKQLTAYVVPDAGADADPARLAEALRRELPPYLIPQLIVPLDELPLTPNGKLDRSALPSPGSVTRDADDTPPRDELEATLAGIWEDFFERRPIGINSSFFDLGGDSLRAVRLMAAVQRVTGRSLPLATLFARPTVALLAEILRDSAAASKRTALVPIRTTGAQPPLLLVHPVGGDVLCYADLAASLGEQRPVYGLQVPDTDPPLASIPELAAHYIEAVGGVPDGRWHLGGWSMGGIVALEMAQQLSRAGASVELLCLIDLLEPPQLGAPPQLSKVDDAALVSWLARDLAGLAQRPWTLTEEELRASDGNHLEIFLDKARAAGVLPPDIDAETLAGIYQRFAGNARAMASYRPMPYAGRVRLFRAADGGASAETTRQWMALCTGDTEVIDVPGDHYTVVRNPQARLLAKQLNSARS